MIQLKSGVPPRTTLKLTSLPSPSVSKILLFSAKQSVSFPATVEDSTCPRELVQRYAFLDFFFSSDVEINAHAGRETQLKNVMPLLAKFNTVRHESNFTLWCQRFSTNHSKVSENRWFEIFRETFSCEMWNTPKWLRVRNQRWTLCVPCKQWLTQGCCCWQGYPTIPINLARTADNSRWFRFPEWSRVVRSRWDEFPGRTTASQSARWPQTHSLINPFPANFYIKKKNHMTSLNTSYKLENRSYFVRQQAHFQKAYELRFQTNQVWFVGHDEKLTIACPLNLAERLFLSQNSFTPNIILFSNPPKLHISVQLPFFGTSFEMFSDG